MPTVQGRYWCWTINNPTETEEQHLATVHLLNQQVQYIVYQREIGQSGTSHLQGYVEFTTRVTKRQAKNIISTRCHIERREGTAVQARDYCIKEDGRQEGPWEYGEFSGTGQPTVRGERTDLSTIRERIKNGASEQQIADEFFASWCRYNIAFRRYRLLCFDHRNWKSRTIILVGPPGTGKSRWCLDNYPKAYWKQRSNWWDGYESHETVIMDDFYGWIPYDTLLRICDRYPLMVETKGAQTTFLAKTVILTSNNTPAQWYKNINLSAFIRRVDLWIYLGTGGLKVETESYEDFCNAVDRNFLTTSFTIN